VSRTGLLATNNRFLIDTVRSTGTLMEYVSVRMLAVILSYMGTIFEQYLDENTKDLLIHKVQENSSYHIARSDKITDTTSTDAFAWNGDIQKRHFDVISRNILNKGYSDYIVNGKEYADISAFVLNLGDDLKHGVPEFHFDFIKNARMHSLEQPSQLNMSRSKLQEEEDFEDVEVICSDEDDEAAVAPTVPVSITIYFLLFDIQY